MNGWGGSFAKNATFSSIRAMSESFASTVREESRKVRCICIANASADLSSTDMAQGISVKVVTDMALTKYEKQEHVWRNGKELDFSTNFQRSISQQIVLVYTVLASANVHVDHVQLFYSD